MILLSYPLPSGEFLEEAKCQSYRQRDELTKEEELSHIPPLSSERTSEFPHKILCVVRHFVVQCHKICERYEQHFFFFFSGVFIYLTNLIQADAQKPDGEVNCPPVTQVQAT